MDFHEPFYDKCVMIRLAFLLMCVCTNGEIIEMR